MYASRVKGRQILLENPARESRAMKELEEKRVRKKRDKEKKKRGIIGKREAKEKSVWKFDQAQAKFVLFSLAGCIFDHGHFFLGILDLIYFSLFIICGWDTYLSFLVYLVNRPSLVPLQWQKLCRIRQACILNF